MMTSSNGNIFRITGPLWGESPGHFHKGQWRRVFMFPLTHWGRVTHICVGKLTIIGSDNGLSPGRRQAIIWNNAEILLIRTLETNFSEILIGIQTFSFKKMYLKMSSAKWRPFCLGLNVLNCAWTNGSGSSWDAGDLKHHHAHYDVTVMWLTLVNSCICYTRQTCEIYQVLPYSYQ